MSEVRPKLRKRVRDDAGAAVSAATAPPARAAVRREGGGSRAGMAAAAAAPKLQHQHELLEEELVGADEAVGTDTFAKLGLCPELCVACAEAGWTRPTRIQAAAIPAVIGDGAATVDAAGRGRDVVGVAQTGSGKTGAYVRPVLHWLLSQPTPPFLAALALVPTRELAMQVAEQFTLLGRGIGLRVATLVGGADAVEQAVQLSRKPHVIVGTPGRVKDHLTNTKGFKLIKLQWLLLDEADKMLDMDYERELDSILEFLPSNRRTMLFSATLSTKMNRLQKACLNDPIMLAVDRKNQTADRLTQKFIFAPFAQMLPYLHVYLTQDAGNHVLIFCASQHVVHRLTLTLRILGHRALPLMGRMSQENRNLALQKFKDGKVRVLVCTDLAQRGLDIPHTDTVINYGLPLSVKEYIHRVGRTARGGSSGKAINLISQYDVAQLALIEGTTEVKMDEHPVSATDVEAVLQRVEDAELEAKREMQEQQQDEDLTQQHHRAAAPKEARRVRSADKDMSFDDGAKRAADGGSGGGFGALRMRRENEEIYGMTKKTQRQGLWKKRREAIKAKKQRAGR